jgi:hypothetical protein
VIANWDRALELEASRDRALAAAVTALSNNPDVDLAALRVIVNDAVRHNTPTAAQNAAALLPLVEAITERVLAADNRDLADEFLRQLRDALPEGN